MWNSRSRGAGIRAGKRRAFPELEGPLRSTKGARGRGLSAEQSHKKGQPECRDPPGTENCWSTGRGLPYCKSGTCDHGGPQVVLSNQDIMLQVF